MRDISVKAPSRFRSAKRTYKRLVKGKVFRKSEFGTGISDMTLRGIIRKRRKRPVGYRQRPVKLELLPSGTQAEYGSQKVRIYIGSEPQQHRAERVLLWSILKHHDLNRHYEIFIMTDLQGFDREKWKTGFTAYRYAIPELAGFQGLAIYNDVDQIYLRDPAGLLEVDMRGSAILAVESRDTSVMLLDCGPLSDVWSIGAVREAPQNSIHTCMLRRVRAKQLIADLPGQWNARDHEYNCNSSSLLHYTILHTQPWRPFPLDLRYSENRQGLPWFSLEEEADAKGFAPLWKSSADRPYADMQDFFKVTTDEGPSGLSTDSGRTTA